MSSTSDPSTRESVRWILHADMDAFYASIEQRDHPELKGLPVIVGATSGRGVVAAASYEARRFGVHSAMPGFRARQLCPQGVFLRSDMRRYVEVSRQVRGVFEEFTSEIEPLALDEAFLDISGSLRLFAGPLALATRLKKRVFEAVKLPVSVGVAPSKLVAKLACTIAKPDGLRLVPPHAVRALLDPLPIRRLWGVGPVMAGRLAALNIRTIGELREYDGHWLQRVLGERAPELQARARGEDARSVDTDRAPKSYGEENTFERDTIAFAAVIAALTSHSEAVARRLRHDGYVGRTITLRFKYAKRQLLIDTERAAQRLYPVVTRSASLSTGTDDAATIKRVAVALWDQEKVTAPIRLIGIAVSTLLERSQAQLELFAAQGRQAQLGPTLDAIQQKFGRDAIQRGVQKTEKITPSHRLKRGE